MFVGTHGIIPGSPGYGNASQSSQAYRGSWTSPQSPSRPFNFAETNRTPRSVPSFLGKLVGAEPAEQKKILAAHLIPQVEVKE